MKPVISVIIPIYESEKFLSKCVDSVLAQTFKDLELILVDDGSKDKSREICDYYAKKDDRVIVVHKLNSGANASRIVGINKSQGKYILFLDSDDMLPDRALESLYKCFLCNNIDIAIGSMIIMHNNKSKVSNNYLDNGIYNRESYIKALLTEKCHSGLHSKLYKKTFYHYGLLAGVLYFFLAMVIGIFSFAAVQVFDLLEKWNMFGWWGGLLDIKGDLSKAGLTASKCFSLMAKGQKDLNMLYLLVIPGVSLVLSFVGRKKKFWYFLLTLAIFAIVGYIACLLPVRGYLGW